MTSDPKSNRFRTPADVRGHLDALGEELDALDGKSLRELLDRFQSRFGARIAPQERGRSERVPYGVISKTPIGSSGSGEVRIFPMVPTRFTHLVVSPFTAKYFELVQLMSGRHPLGGSSDPLPLETFSIEYGHDDTLCAVQSFKIPMTEVGQSFVILFQRRADTEHLSPEYFRGLFWADVVFP
jgi:hypothetical protein